MGCSAARLLLVLGLQHGSGWGQDPHLFTHAIHLRARSVAIIHAARTMSGQANRASSNPSSDNTVPFEKWNHTTLTQMKFVKSLPSELYKLDSQYRTLVENGFIIERGYTICSSPRQAADLADGIALEYDSENPAPATYVPAPRPLGASSPRVAPGSATPSSGSGAPASAPSPAPPTGRPGLSGDLTDQGYRVQPLVLTQKRKALTDSIANLCEVPDDLRELAKDSTVNSIGTELLRDARWRPG